MPIDTSQIGKPMALMPRSSRTAPIPSPPKQSHRSSGSLSILHGVIPGVGKSAKPATDSASDAPDVSAHKPPRKRTVSGASITPSPKSSVNGPSPSVQVHDPLSSTPTLPTPPHGKRDSFKHSSTSPSFQPAPIKPLHYSSTSRAEAINHHNEHSSRGSDSSRVDPRLLSKTQSKVVRFRDDPVAERISPTLNVDPDRPNFRTNDCVADFDPSIARLSMGLDIKVDIFGPFLAYIAISETLQHGVAFKVLRQIHELVSKVRISIEKVENPGGSKRETSTKETINVVKYSLTSINSRRRLDYTIEILSQWVKNMTADKPLPFHDQRVEKLTEAQLKMIQTVKEENEMVLADCHDLVDFLWADFKAYMRSLQQDSEEAVEDGDKPILQPEVKALVEEILELKKSGGMLKAILASFRKFARLSSNTVVNRLKKFRMNEDSVSSGPDNTLASLTSTGLSSSTTLGSSTSSDPSCDSSSSDEHEPVSLRNSKVFFDVICPELGITPETPLGESSKIWDDKTVTLSSLIFELTDPLRAHKKGIHILFEVFFLFFREFTDPTTLLGTLKAQFSRQLPHRNYPSSLSKNWDIRQSYAQLRIIQLIGLWVKYHWYEACDGSIRRPLYDFLHGLVPYARKSALNIAVLKLLPLVLKSGTSVVPSRFKELRNDETDLVEHPPTGFEQLSLLEKMRTRLDLVDIAFFSDEGGCEELAAALTLIESDFFHSFLPGDITMWCSKMQGSAMVKWDTFINSLILWIPKTILNQKFDCDMAEIMQLWIRVAAVSSLICGYRCSLNIIFDSVASNFATTVLLFLLLLPLSRA